MGDANNRNLIINIKSQSNTKMCPLYRTIKSEFESMKNLQLLCLSYFPFLGSSLILKTPYCPI